MDADIARAATTVLVTTEEIVSEEETRRYPDRTVVPGFVVDALVHVPFGSFPHECYGLYEADYDHFAEYTRGDRRARPRGRRRLSRALRLRAADVERLPRSVRRRAHWRCRRKRAKELSAMTCQRVARAAGRDRRAPASRRHDGLRGCRRAAPGRGARQAAPRAAADDGHRGRHHRPADRAGAAAGVDQRDARRPPRDDAAGHHRRVPLRPARLRGRRLHGRRADRPVRQHQHERARQRLLAPESAPARNRRRQRHRARCAARSSSSRRTRSGASSSASISSRARPGSGATARARRPAYSSAASRAS